MATGLSTGPGEDRFYKAAPADLTPIQSMALDTQSDPAVAEAITKWAAHLE